MTKLEGRHIVGQGEFERLTTAQQEAVITVILQCIASNKAEAGTLDHGLGDVYAYPHPSQGSDLISWGVNSPYNIARGIFSPH